MNCPRRFAAKLRGGVPSAVHRGSGVGGAKALRRSLAPLQERGRFGTAKSSSEGGKERTLAAAPADGVVSKSIAIQGESSAAPP